MKTTTSNLQLQVLDELRWEPSVDSSRIGVSVENDVVVLAGHVHSLLERRTAENAVKRLRGVHAVANELEVDLLASHPRDDVQIAKAVEHALRWHVDVPADRLVITVSKGWVTVEGRVPFAYQREAACRTIEHIPGVRGLTANVTVQPEVSPTDLRRRLHTALHRYATVEAGNIETEVDGSRVVLRGKVRSWAERDQVQDAAWSAPGVTEVDNRIAVAQ